MGIRATIFVLLPFAGGREYNLRYAFGFPEMLLPLLQQPVHWYQLLYHQNFEDIVCHSNNASHL